MIYDDKLILHKAIETTGKTFVVQPCSWASITVCGEAEEHGEEEARGLFEDAEGQDIPSAVCFSKQLPPTAQPVVLTKTQKMLHKNLNHLVGVLKAAINMQK